MDIQELNKYINNYLDQEHQSLVQLLQSFVIVQSGTGNIKGINTIQHQIASLLRAYDFAVQLIPGVAYGEQLYATKGRGQGLKVLFVGHVDTVFDQGASTSWKVSGDRLCGQGVLDMKGGITVMLAAIAIMNQIGELDALELGVYLNSHEEVGSLEAEMVLENLAKQYDVALVFEAGGSHGEVVTARMGCVEYEISVEGRAGHAGNFIGERANAIEELAYICVIVKEWATHHPELFINIGTIEGGEKANIIASRAQACLDVRYQQQERLEAFAHFLEQVKQHPMVAGTKCTMTRRDLFLPMFQSASSKILFGFVQQAGQSIGIEINSEHRGGCSDANILGQAGIAIIDGIGVYGGGVHTEQEYMVAESLSERIRLVCAVLNLLIDDGSLSSK
jgi:glutamate carboxypeptidase